MAANPTFLGIPVEIRLAIYDAYLTEHQRVKRNPLPTQPTNAHYRVLHTCSQMNQEARPLFRRYISLRHERQINAFILYADGDHAAAVLWADVANDGRVFSTVCSSTLEQTGGKKETTSPLSNLHLALRRMPSVTHLRVFPCRQGLPVNMKKPGAAQLGMKFEIAMYPTESQHELTAYELYLDAGTRAQPFQVVSPKRLEKLRLSGDCHLPIPSPPPTPALRQVTLYAITGNYFDKQSIDKCFPGSRIESFSYGLGHKLAFELRNSHLESVVSLSGARLRKLVLLGCTRLTTDAIAACLDRLTALEYLALSLTTVGELRTNFVLSLSPTVSVVKLHVMNAWYAVPLLAEERSLCDALENTVLDRDNPPSQVCVRFRDKLMIEEGRREKWQELADQRHIEMVFGNWEGSEQEEL